MSHTITRDLPRRTDSTTKLTAKIKEKALALGFDAVGICPAHLKSFVKENLIDFLEKGYHGGMDWLATRVDQRSQPTTLWPEARSIIVVGLSYTPTHLTPPVVTYAKTQPPSQLPSDQLPSDCGYISVYARNRDYHNFMKGRLKHLAQFIVHLQKENKQTKITPNVKVFVDTAPVAEKPLAVQAGLGWQGKHTNLVSRQHGNWLFLGELYTTLDLWPSSSARNHCGSCSRCLTVCPTQAFSAPYQLDARRCISYLTIEHTGSIPEILRPLIGTRIYGCDDCLAICPWNRFAQASRHIPFHPRKELIAPKLAFLSQLDDSSFRSFFSGSPIKRIGRNRFIRNVLIAIGNTNNLDLLPYAANLRTETNPLIAETAHWAYQRLLACLKQKK
ncbi:MAG: tRNA epoxyqueuosine(34) reductase QueG [Acetobacter sp.]|nr:tRNA epoxyqueuosine(34) reductase QueG [Acetobacter sp.]MBQ5469687.1 tRNA epoxyqueuosine(34) reductase QueG [Acetobacter sp.]